MSSYLLKKRVFMDGKLHLASTAFKSICPGRLSRGLAVGFGT